MKSGSENKVDMTSLSGKMENLLKMTLASENGKIIENLEEIIKICKTEGFNNFIEDSFMNNIIKGIDDRKRILENSKKSMKELFSEIEEVYAIFGTSEIKQNRGIYKI